MKRGISQSTVIAYNPLPKITRAQVAEKAGIYDPRADGRDAFLLDWTFSSGAEAESVALAPQEFRILKKDEATWMLNDLKDEGLVVVDVAPGDFKSSNPVVKAAVLAALHRAKNFYFQNGKERLMKQQAAHGYNTEQMETFKNNKFAPLVLNSAKEAEIDKEIARLSSKPVEKV